jgi:hypothetical protein
VVWLHGRSTVPYFTGLYVCEGRLCCHRTVTTGSTPGNSIKGEREVLTTGLILRINTRSYKPS